MKKVIFLSTIPTKRSCCIRHTTPWTFQFAVILNNSRMNDLDRAKNHTIPILHKRAFFARELQVEESHSFEINYKLAAPEIKKLIPDSSSPRGPTALVKILFVIISLCAKNICNILTLFIYLICVSRNDCGIIPESCTSTVYPLLRQLCFGLFIAQKAEETSIFAKCAYQRLQFANASKYKWFNRHHTEKPFYFIMNNWVLRIDEPIRTIQIPETFKTK